MHKLKRIRMSTIKRWDLSDERLRAEGYVRDPYSLDYVLIPGVKYHQRMEQEEQLQTAARESCFEVHTAANSSGIASFKVTETMNQAHDVIALTSTPPVGSSSKYQPKPDPFPPRLRKQIQEREERKKGKKDERPT